MPPSTPPLKPASQSLTIRSAVAAALVPILSALIMKHLGIDPETSNQVAAALFMALSSLAIVGLRRAQGLAALLLILLPLALMGCCSHPDLKPTLTLFREVFERDAAEARSGAIRLDADEGRNKQRLEARAKARDQLARNAAAALGPEKAAK